MLTLARNAMATRFEIVLHGDNPVALRAAGEEAFDEIDRLEAQLSLYRPASEISNLNARAAREPVRVSPELFTLLQRATELHRQTHGAFDITVGPLTRCWGFMRRQGNIPDPQMLADARAQTGLHLVHLNAADSTVRFEREGVMLDLGAIGKGYAVEKAAAILRETGVSSALIHGGTSTVYGLGNPPEAKAWKVAIDALPTPNPHPEAPRSSDANPQPIVHLKDEALSVSAIWGKSFEAAGKTFGHVLDPRTGQPVAGTVLSAVILPDATETDALSTALLVVGAAGHKQIAALRPGMKTLVVSETDKGFSMKGPFLER